MDDDIDTWLVLMMLPATPSLHPGRLLDHFGSPGGILRAPRRELEQAGLAQRSIDLLHNVRRHTVARARAWLHHPAHHFIPYTHAQYPARLKEIPQPPMGLFIRGMPELLHTTQLGVVGSRNPTPAGIENTGFLTSQLAVLGIKITSGLAVGIDYYSHMAALEAGGVTIAVLGHGPDRVYPRHHAELAEHIAAQGALVSEFMPGVPPVPVNFPRRNRLISGLSAGVLVIEAARNSGSLITARHALEQGREVFAVPGSIHNPLARGCHGLIKQGAKLVENCADILEELNISTLSATLPSGDSPAEQRLQLDDKHKNLLRYINNDPVSVDTLVTYTGLTVAAVSSMLLTLELQGAITQAAGGCYMRRMLSTQNSIS